MKKTIFFLLIIILVNQGLFAQTDSVIVNSTGSSLVNFNSDNKGILVPRLTTTQRNSGISSPATGLLVYDTDLNQFCYYDGASWICGWNLYTSGGSCVTLDSAYDCSVPGAGRMISVDAGAVLMNGDISSFSGSTLELNNKSTGAVLQISDLIPSGAGSEGIIVFGQDNSSLATYDIIGAVNTNDVIKSKTTGTGQAGTFMIENSAATSDALEGHTLGSRHGVLGVTGIKNATVGTGFNIANVPSSGVTGLSTTSFLRKGTSGESIASDGVWGRSYAAASKYNSLSNMDSLIAGVHGSMEALHSTTESKDFFGVFGITSGNGTGVLGIGGGSAHGVKGHGVMGVSAWSKITPSTNAGVWGVTRDESDWAALRARFPLEEESFNKVQVGVLGQSKEFVAIWGESLEKIGVVGNVNQQLSLSDLDSCEMAGVMGINALEGNGVEGKAFSDEYDDAGVKASGHWDKDKAAALEIHDGAIRVSRDSAMHTPADVIEVEIPYWIPTPTCEAPPGPHAHIQNFISGPIVISNQYVDPIRSVLLVSVMSDILGVSIKLVSQSDGEFEVELTVHSAYCPEFGFNQPPLESIHYQIHYLIINK